MLITFKSRASGDVIMFEKDAKEILGVLGKEPGDTQGIVTLEQLPGAINSLKAAIHADQSIHHEPTGHDEETEPPVSLHQRALPILELLERSLKDNVPVTWGI